MEFKYWNKFWFRAILFFIYLIVLCLIFSGIYSYLYNEGLDFQDKFNNWYDPIYFSWITMTSTGYGDISPTSGYGKFTVCLQIFIFLVSMVVFTILSLEKDILKPSFKKCRS